MEDIKKLIDLEKHMLWSRNAEKAIRSDLATRYPDRIDELWEKTVLQYAEYLKDQPYIGGKKNRQASGVYDSIIVVAYYKVLPEPLSLEELEKVNYDIFRPVYERIEGKVNANNPLFLRIMHLAFKTVEKGVHRHEKDWPGNYHMEVMPLDKERGIEYKFLTCPIADFAKRIGVTELMPALCNADYPMLEQMKAGLIREYTCSNGPYCDYWIMGNKSKLLEENPVYRDENGYERNKIKR